MSEAPPKETPKLESQQEERPELDPNRPLVEMREVARNQAIRCYALVKEAETHAKANGEHPDVVLERMIMSRLEEKSAATVQARVAHAAYLDAYERIIMVGNGIHKDPNIKKDVIIERLTILASGIKDTGENMIKNVAKV